MLDLCNALTLVDIKPPLMDHKLLMIVLITSLLLLQASRIASTKCVSLASIVSKSRSRRANWQALSEFTDAMAAAVCCLAKSTIMYLCANVRQATTSEAATSLPVYTHYNFFMTLLSIPSICICRVLVSVMPSVKAAAKTGEITPKDRCGESQRFYGFAPS